LSGIREVLTSAGLEPASGHLCPDWLPPHGFAATRELLRLHPRPGAIICFNDRLAFGSYQALQEAGLTIPDDVSVVSFDNYPMAEWLRPGLSSFAIPHELLGRRAVELLIEAVQFGPGTAVGPTHRYALPLHSRGSVSVVSKDRQDSIL